VAATSLTRRSRAPPTGSAPRLHHSAPAPHCPPRSWRMHAADRHHHFAGSMPFVYLHTAWFGLWIVVNLRPGHAGRLNLSTVRPFPFAC